MKHRAATYYSYITYFQTTGVWETIKIPLIEMYPSFRGRKLSGPHYSHNSIEEITFLIGNQRAEKFELLLDTIEIE